MHDPAYKLLFSRPRMVRDLLRGFAARGWSDALDFDTLTPLPAAFVGEDLRQRHGDLVWRVGFRGGGWLYLVLLLEFQATVDRAMAVRMLAYTAMLQQRLIADGALDEHGALPPVLPVVLYNGRRRWTAPVEVADLIAAEDEALAPYQPSQRYYLLDVGRVPDADLPAGNLVSALAGLEKARGTRGMDAALGALIELLAAAGDEHLERAFMAWLRWGVREAGPLPPVGGDALAQLKETRTMLEETVREWTRDWLERGRDEGIAQGIAQGRDEGIAQGRDEGIAQGRAQGIAQGRAQGIAQGRDEERALLCRQAARKFNGAAAEGLAAALAGVSDPERLGRVGEWIIECATASDLLARVRRDRGSDG